MSNPMNFLKTLMRPFHSAASGLTPEQAASVTSAPAGAQKATIAAGCFWGIEHLYRKHFGGKGLYDAQVGYIGGNTNNPSYRAVCSGATGHAEALQVTYNPSELSYSSLLEFFYRIHDPTTPNRQGMDTGTQYRSGIFYHDEEQKKIAQEVTEKAQAQWWGKNGGKIVTEILPAGTWWPAEQYHQLYLHHNPGGYECPAHHVRGFPELS